MDFSNFTLCEVELDSFVPDALENEAIGNEEGVQTDEAARTEEIRIDSEMSPERKGSDQAGSDEETSDGRLHVGPEGEELTSKQRKRPRLDEENHPVDQDGQRRVKGGPSNRRVKYTVSKNVPPPGSVRSLVSIPPYPSYSFVHVFPRINFFILNRESRS